jgi:phosphatidate cytidylyltransferase
MSNLLARALTGIIAGSITVALIVLSPWGLLAFCVIVSLLGLREFYHITGVAKAVTAYMIGVAAVIWAWFAIANLVPVDEVSPRSFVFFELNWHVCAGIVFGVAAVISLFNYRGPAPVTEMGLVVLGAIYVFLPFVLLFMSGIDPMDYASSLRDPLASYGGLRADLYKFSIPLGILLLTWALDVFAYFGGKYLGKHKLWERISPKKTWEGAIVGALATMGLSVAFEMMWEQHWSWLVVGGIIAVFSQLGDLVESMYKRGLQLKDSGGILPGHGGILDRFDGLLITLPMIYLYIYASNF